MSEIRFTVTVDEANLILEGLGNLPFAKVYALVGKLQQQAGEQIGKTPDSFAAAGEEEPDAS